MNNLGKQRNEMAFEQGELQDSPPTPKRTDEAGVRESEEVKVSIHDGFLEVTVERSSALGK